MSSINKKTIYLILSDNELIKYLDNRDIGELILSCKFIYNKCFKYTLNTLHVNFGMVPRIEDENINEFNSGEDLLSKQAVHVTKLIEGRQQYTSFLKAGPELNYYILTKLINSFTNLISLELNIIIAPKHSIQLIFNNLENLLTLNLINVVITLPSKEQNSGGLKLPNCLKNLELIRCREIATDISQPIALSIYLYKIDFSDISFINIDTTSMAHLNQLSYQDSEPIHNSSLTRLLINNAKLAQVNTTFSNLNVESFNSISTNPNISNLAFDFFYYEAPSAITLPADLPFPYIKSLQFNTIPGSFLEIVKTLVNNCPNLEQLECYLTPRYELEDLLNSSSLPKLKRLIINNYAETCKATLSPLPELDLEYIEFGKFDPMKIDFSIFSNLSKLKRIKITSRPVHLENYQSIQEYYNSLKSWRIDYYPLSLNCWKA
ncbi:hypothetical protein CONCODRAFT_155786 [Conidiobolus coronatus NRRL 28638]|uniref:F-box domain-containing protein n=1 Tax=Conidiobolus coronatus (strain ATCC 28846 / CBS 209.66 / NRRL 28638) TaxID=796925 RepID=A0A137P7K8_CONC2|nr:hypothetical protein CONCODRAFT_155786 [Conidiobolus coronatus NRRL 28638]|eukprot:KXN70975.1 hypothetical protein CONCODRAFT_155786 [Conidiobolus coronatus NRRL 28638]